VSTARLITIPLSHYCEKARWALDRAGLAYREEPHAPLLHLIATKLNRGSSVPILIHRQRRFTDSSDIVAHADTDCGGGLLYSKDPARRRDAAALEKYFDTELGPHARRWAYWQLLPETALLRSLWSSRVPAIEARLIGATTPLVRRLVSSAYRIEQATAQRSLDRVRRVFAQVDTHLNDGRRFLVGEEFSAADLTFASLAAPVLFPRGCRAVMPALEAVPASMREEVLRLRATVSGQYALRLYEDERGTGTTRGSSSN
jgi:glutathione S-transferase